MEEGKSYGAFWGEKVEKKGVRIGDCIDLIPLQGKKRSIPLLRTEYRLEASGEYQAVVLGQRLLLSSFAQESMSYRLRLVSEGDKERYILESLDCRPFQLNGQSVFSAYLLRGDRVLIGHNQLNFSMDKVGSDDQDELLPLSQKVIQSGLNILIEGETGTGKTHLARKIHHESKRKGAFIQLNLASFGEALIESELFGHVRGAFTGAHRPKEGALSEANFGTLFLDEIDSLSLAMQTKLLIFLDQKEFRPVGGSGVKRVDVRLIVASGRDLKQMVESGKMRSDFYFRIASGQRVRLESLRDDPKRFEKALEVYCREHDVVMCDDLKQLYRQFSWPGNMRQLLSHLEHKRVIEEGRVWGVSEIDRQLTSQQAIVSDNFTGDEIKPLEEIKHHYVAWVLGRLKFNKKLAAELLDISPPTLKSIIEKSNIYPLGSLAV